MLKFNSLDKNLFTMSAATKEAEGDRGRGFLLSCGRTLMRDYGIKSMTGKGDLDEKVYHDLNDKFIRNRALFAAKVACDAVKRDAPETYEDFMRQLPRFRADSTFLKVLQGLDEDIIYPVLPTTYSEAVNAFADVVDVSYGTTKEITVGSNDIPFFSDSAWGAIRNIPANRLYDATYTLNPQPKAARMEAKWHQLMGNGMDFGRYYSALAAGMYAKTMAMFQSALTTAVADTSIVPSSLSITYSTPNFIALANTIAALNGVDIRQLVTFGGYVPLSKILPTTVTGASNVNMDAAIATLLGPEYVRTGYIGEQSGVKLLPLRDAIVPGTQNTAPATILPNNKAFMMASNGYKPMTIAMDTNTPLTLEYQWKDSASADDIDIVVVSSLDMVVTMASKIGVINGL